MLTLMSPPFPLISHSVAFFSSTHLYFTFCVMCVSGPADLNLMSKCAPCLAAPCQNNGTCVSDVTGSYHCTCPFGYKVSEQPTAHIHHLVASILSYTEYTEYSFELCASLHAREPHHPSSQAQLPVSEFLD